MLASSMLFVGLLIGLSESPAAAVVTPVTSVKGSACTYYVKVGLFGGPQQLKGCGSGVPATDVGFSPNVILPAAGSATAVTQTDADGAKAVYGPAVIHGGIWPENVASPTASGPQSASTQGTPAGGTVTSSADITLKAQPYPTVPCEVGFSPPCTDPGGFGPPPVWGDSLHVECSASAAGVSATTTFSRAFLATATDAGGSPLLSATEPIPNNPPINYTRSGVITNVGDVFTVVLNQQIVNPDKSITVNAVHMYLFGPTAIGELVRGQANCGTNPSTAASTDTVAPSCGTPVVEPLGPDNPTPKTPRTELVGVFDAGTGAAPTGLQSITNIQAVNADVVIGNPDPAYPAYTKFIPGQTGPLQMTAISRNDALPMVWSFDATDAAGNITHCNGAQSVPGVAFHPLTPSRILDSRPAPNQVGPYGTPWTAGLSRDVTVTGAGAVPANAVAVVLNATVTGTTGAGYLTIWPAGQAQPLASSLNWAPGQTIPNAVTVKVGAGGKVSVYNAVGNASVIFDVVGYYDANPGEGFTSLTPARILDSRAAPNQVGPYGTPWTPGLTRDVTVTGVGSVPAGADAVVLNVTVTGTTGAGYLTIWPAGQAQPLASSLNWAPGQTIPNAVTVKVGAAGKISVLNPVGNTNVIVDVVGYFASGSGQLFHPISPGRVLDSRSGAPVGPYSTPWGPDTSRDVDVISGPPAALLNVTVTGTTGGSYLTIWPAGQAAPLASSLNWAPGDTIANSVTTKLSATGAITMKNAAGNVNVLADVAGWFGGAA